MLTYKIPKPVNFVLNSLKDKGYEAYLVGGCVRDMVLNKSPGDYDVCTNAKPAEILEVFKYKKTIDIGSKFGTVVVICDKYAVEITTYRVDGEYTDGRHPDEVMFSASLFEDLLRRDFTMNAMAFNSRIIDPFNGVGDINKKIIRCVGDANKRFKEDALRILRAVRFAAQLKFHIEEQTSYAILENAFLLNKISKERKSEELLKFLSYNNLSELMIKYKRVFEFVLLGDMYVEVELWNKISMTADKCNSPLQKLALIYFLAPKACNDYKTMLDRLSLPKAMKKEILNILNNMEHKPKADKQSIKRDMNRIGENTYFNFLWVYGAANKTDIGEIFKIAEKILLKGECFSLSSLAVKGNDLIGMGIKNGKDVGAILDMCLEEVICERCANDKDELLKFISKIRYEKF